MFIKIFSKNIHIIYTNYFFYIYILNLLLYNIYIFHFLLNIYDKIAMQIKIRIIIIFLQVIK